MGCIKISSNRDIYSNTILPQEARKTSNRQPHFTLKKLEEKEEEEEEEQQQQQQQKLLEGKNS